jgi:hypothetical protein
LEQEHEAYVEAVRRIVSGALRIEGRKAVFNVEAAKNAEFDEDFSE